MQNKAFDPRNPKVLNPFVQAYVEKQTQKSKPIGDRQKIVNILFSAVLLINVVTLTLVVLSPRATPESVLTGERQNETMGEAMAKIRLMEINLQSMRSSVEYHKNAYFKLEQEHETMKAALARVVPPENSKEILASYPTPVSLNVAPAESVQTVYATPAVQAGRGTAVAATISAQTNGQ